MQICTTSTNILYVIDVSFLVSGRSTLVSPHTCALLDTDTAPCAHDVFKNSIWTTAYRTSLCDEWACRIITPKCIHDRLGSYNYIGVCGVCVRRLHQITTWILVSVFTTKRNTIIAKCAPFTFSLVLLRENVRTSWHRYGR